MRKRLMFIVIGAFALIALGAVAWYLGSPLFINRTVEDAFPGETSTPPGIEVMPENAGGELATQLAGTSQAMPDKEMQEQMPAEGEPTALRAGMFVDADNFHRGSGSATIFELPDGDRILRFEGFMVTNGPDLHVYLAAGPHPTGRDDLGEHFDLGALKGNIGDQNYAIPPDLGLEDYQSVVIYCVPFHVVFSTASLVE
ncbi:MAG: DM13 domain-containing protein [Anaerolineales bacterium]